MHTLNDRAYIDSLASERYFDSTKVILKEKLLKKRKGYLRGIPLDKHATDSITLRVNQMCKQLDDVKKKYLDKNFKSLRFADYQNMYVEMSQTIIDLYSLSSNIEIIPLSETLLMRCWLTKVGGQEHAIFAFPSKYSTDEIGFISQDKAISDYIHKMLSGIQNGMLHSDRHH
jgi:hypothetical protein